jgi:MFS family permease
MISLWYRRSEHALRIGIFFSAATVAGAFGGLVAYGIVHLHEVLGLRAWQWIFILEGIPTIVCALLAFALLPDFPETSTFLTPAEKALSIQRIKEDVGPATSTEFSWQEFRATFRDWKVYAHMIIGFFHSIAFASLGLFVPSITLGFGFE